jgi:excisionase family DNA binding protein
MSTAMADHVPRCLSVADAAAYTGFSEAFIRRLVARREIPFLCTDGRELTRRAASASATGNGAGGHERRRYRRSGRVYLLREDLDAFIQARLTRELRPSATPAAAAAEPIVVPTRRRFS